MTTYHRSPAAPAPDTWAVHPDTGPGPGLRACLEAAILAPSIYNTQPWRFRLHGGAIELYADQSRRLTVVDPRGREMMISLGAALLNLRVAIRRYGRTPLTSLLPDPTGPDLVARVGLGPGSRADETVRLLAEAIARRHTNRRPFTTVAVPEEVLAELVGAARAEGARLLVAGDVERAYVLGLVRSADTRLRASRGYRDELAGWTNPDPPRRDGVPRTAFGPWDALETLPLRDFGLTHPHQPRRQAHFEADPTIVVLSTTGDSPADWLHAGQALQRVLLTATVRGLATTPMSQPMEIPELRELLADPVHGGVPQVVLRLGYGPASAASPRRPLADVLDPR